VANSRLRATRRTLIGGAAALGAARLLPRSAGAQEASPAAGPWRFTDDLGVTVELPQRPTRIVADLNAAAPLWDFGVRPIAVSGWTVASDASWANVERSVPVINATEGEPEPDLESLLAVDAELFVTIAWAEDDIWSFTSAETYKATQAVVPVVCISVAGMANENLQRFAELSEALGTDLASPELTAAKAEFDAAVEKFSATVAAKSDVVSLFAGVPTEGADWYLANPEDWADLAWYQSLGMNLLEPDVEKGKFWEILSREQANKYPSDVFFLSLRAGRMSNEELRADPLFAVHPAVAANQIGGWNQDFVLSYQGLTDALTTMEATLATAEKVTG
jgi:iron complex transport system substrate-binding protein